MPDELIDICDEQNNLLNIQKMKGEAQKNGLWHRAVHIWMYTPDGEILLQLRAKEKKLYPDMWDISVAGHVGAGETPEMAVRRELKEEIGVALTPNNLLFLNVRKQEEPWDDIIENEFCYVYLLPCGKMIMQNALQKEEVQAIEFFSCERLRKELKDVPKKFTPHGEYWFEIISEVEKRCTH